MNYFKRFYLKLRTIRIKRLKNLSIGTKNYFYYNTEISFIYGGKIEIGNNNEFLNGVLLMTYGGKIKIGSNCSFNPHSIIYGHGNGVEIGNDVLIAANCVIIPCNHVFVDKKRLIREQDIISKGIIIEDDVWIGANVTVLDGAIIRKGAIIAAGSVVRGEIESYKIYGGSPAKYIKDR